MTVLAGDNADPTPLQQIKTRFGNRYITSAASGVREPGHTNFTPQILNFSKLSHPV